AENSSALADAELYLKSCGVPEGLPSLPLSFGNRAVNHGSAQFQKKADLFLQKPPAIHFDPSLGRCSLVMLDPDAPARAGDGSGPAPFGPWLHWLVTDCDGGSVAGGRQLCSYMGPAPPRGNHRYIFVLFQQLGDVQLLPLVSVERRQWDFPAFMSLNQHVLKPVAANFFYCSSQ
ncbi:unnamed protein product, partial [Polarella glacialis]